MNYVVTVNGEKYEVEVERVGGGTSSLSRRPPERVSRPVQAAPAAQPVAAPQPAAPAPAAPAASGGAGTIVSPMPGTVLDVKVKEGDAVSVGQVVIILEAMKMETEIVSEVAGSVAAVRVKKGDAVDTDTVLVEVK
ncbi:biotin/lipoyl-binding protein [Treponema sp. OMZ 305]|uniref:biotin/lipoyl-containing protein n=1 Tax=Treponema TaxID=157 RepID=UPI001BB0A544|nr:MULTISPECIES: biotin/lipoyl-containing protein [Treponema]QUY18586.1 biotin/lipoyl-binding protein [Treponema vincentii]UTC58466.1 biotin/lipoyl-binding protein [Treponema sp. OMZ 305]